jgi:hypothetical protein
MRYDSNHDPSEEWVYNGADIDGSKVVWARDMGETQNLELIRYFKDRKIWLLEPDLTPPKLSPYPAFPGPVAQAVSGFDEINRSSNAPDGTRSRPSRISNGE